MLTYYKMAQVSESWSEEQKKLDDIDEATETNFILIFVIFILVGCSTLMFLITYLFYIIYLSLYSEID